MNQFISQVQTSLWYFSEYGWYYIAVSSFLISPLCYIHYHTTINYTLQCILSLKLFELFDSFNTQ